MRRIFTLFTIAAAFAAAISAQQSLVAVRVYSSAPGAYFRVDGMEYRDAAAFMWPAGSKHVLQGDQIRQRDLGARYLFKQWATAGDLPVQPIAPVVTVTADPALPFFRLDITLEYTLNLTFFRCDDGPCQSSGTVYVDGAPYTQSAQIWVESGRIVAMQAVANPGYVFVGWLDAAGNTIQGSFNKITVTGPTNASARFEPARPIRLETVPENLLLFVDRTTVPTPRVMEWGFSTTHTLAAVSPQNDEHGKAWVFKSWSDNGAATHPYTVKPATTEDVITGTFVPGARVTFLTSPPGLKLRVDGRDNWYGGYNFTWGVGETHRTEAPAEQADAQGRRYAFKGWSNGAAAAQQDLTVADADAANGVRLTAMYEQLGRLVVQTTSGAQSVSVDGSDCRTPCVLDRPAGTQVKIAAPAAVAAGESSRYVFQGWNDSAAPERNVAFTTDSVTLTASYRLMHRLVAVAEPSEGAVWRAQPDSQDGFYDAGTQVALKVESRPGFRFRRFEGDLAGSFTSGELTMSAPKAVRAIFDRVPYIAPAGVRNAAAETPVAAVAPGSVISIFGAHLAPDAATGPDSPLVQTLAGVTVRMGDRYLPLFFVSPDQINAQVPSDTEPGQKTLSVKWDGQAEVRADFDVARNAPGLFQSLVEGEAYAIAIHEDGSAVSPAAPAKRGETVTIYGTGFGPCDRRPPDGFALPQAPLFTQADRVQVAAGEAMLEPVWAGAAPDRVGINALRLLIGSDLPSGNVKLAVRINGQDSNTVALPVE